MKTPDYTQVAEKLRIYDAIWCEDVVAMNGKQTLDWMDRLSDAEDEVREAFANATADRNHRDNAMLINPGCPQGPGRHPDDISTLRKWLKQSGFYYGQA